MLSDHLKEVVIIMTKKLRYETHLDHELREYYRAKPVKGYPLLPFPRPTLGDNKIAVLDSQGRHRSEWCYAPYDGRVSGVKSK